MRIPRDIFARFRTTDRTRPILLIAGWLSIEVINEVSLSTSMSSRNSSRFKIDFAGTTKAERVVHTCVSRKTRSALLLASVNRERSPKLANRNIALRITRLQWWFGNTWVRIWYVEDSALVNK